VGYLSALENSSEGEAERLKRSKQSERLEKAGKRLFCFPFSGLKGVFKRREGPAPAPTAVLERLPPEAQVIDSYPVNWPYAKVTIASLPSLGGDKAYFIEEVELSPKEQYILNRLIDILSLEVEPPKSDDVDAKAYVEAEARRLIKKYRIAKNLSEDSWQRIAYYLKRDLIGYGPLDVIMNDRTIEDISVNGIGIPVYVWHRCYESMPTNLRIVNEATLDNVLIKLTHVAQKHISTAFPILDAMLPTKDRVAATFKREVSPKGSTFCIRRFREEPFSVIDLIELGTLDEALAAYFWLMLENRMTVAVIGGTGAGKTSTLNALATLIRPSMKIVTVEEIPELMLPHDNWVQLVARPSYGLGASKAGEITLFDLVKVSLRYRPDYIVVGEVRGEEAFVLFQAMATGHGGLTTLHAETLEHAIKRLTSPPMNIAEAYIPLINIAILQERVQFLRPVKGLTFGRRIRKVYEVISYDEYRDVVEWDVVNDVYRVNFKESVMVDIIAQKLGLTREEVLQEILRRAHFFRDLRLRGVRANMAVRNEMVKYRLLNSFPFPRPLARRSEER